MRKPVVIGLIIAAVILICCGGGIAAIAGMGGGAPDNPIPEPGTSTTTARATVSPSDAVAKPPAAKGIKDGGWLVGRDVPAGRYHSAGPADGLFCLWTKTTTPDAQPGEKGFITNDAPPGPSYVSLAAGQYFTTSHCGTWTVR